VNSRITLPPLHPFLFALFPILFLFSKNMNEFPLAVILVPALKSIVLTLAGLTVAAACLRNWKKAGIVVSLFVVIYFSYGHLRDALYGLSLPLDRLPHGIHMVLFPLISIIFIAGVLRVARSRAEPVNLTKILNMAAFILVAVSLAQIAVHVVGTREAERFDVDRVFFDDSDGVLVRPETLPNIYYIVLDGYPSGDNLTELYDFDNSGFLNALASRGFFIAAGATSNYSNTIHSLASSLNFSYLDPIIECVGEESSNLGPLREAVENNKARCLLKQFGYRFVTIWSGFHNTDLKKADIYLMPSRKGGEFEEALLQTTALSPVVAWFSRVSTTVAGAQRAKDRERILYAFDKTVEAADFDFPVFLFAHIVAPHPPFVFDSEGLDVEEDRYYSFQDANNLIGPAGITRSRYRDLFRDQLIFINGQVTALVDSLISKSPSPPIIIVQGDHGPGAFSHHSRLDCTYLGDRMSILYALHFPGIADSLLDDFMTPVNAFRVIFNAYFGGAYGLLENRNYYHHYVTPGRPYRFIDVTGEIGSEADKRRLELLQSLDYYPELE
jgi:hypothetical protein